MSPTVYTDDVAHNEISLPPISNQLAISPLNVEPLVCAVKHLYSFPLFITKSFTIYGIPDDQLSIAFEDISCQLALSALNVVDVCAVIHLYSLLLLIVNSFTP